MSKRFVAYYRVSTKRQGRSGLGLDAQKSAVENYLNNCNGEVVSEYTEVESGKRTDIDRPMLHEALAACRVHKATLVISKLDRLARNAKFLFELQDSGLDFICCDMPSANRLTIGIMALVAEEERKMISKRTKEALAAAKARGIKLGTNNLTSEGVKKGVLNAVEVRKSKSNSFCMDIIGVINSIKETGYTSLNAIADELNKRGITTYRNCQWKPNSVKRILDRAAMAA